MSPIQEALLHLQQALRFETVSSHQEDQVDQAAMTGFLAFLEQTYPLAHQRMKKTLVNDHGLVLRWAGRDTKRRVLLTAHYDVVPATDKGWPHPPFGGVLWQDRVYGRGAFDDKGSLIALMESASMLIQQGFVPPCDVYFAFGFDEEVGGAKGAAQMAAYFKQQGLRFDFVLDEGGAVADGAIMGITKPVAVVGLAEKGNSSFELHFVGEGGHSSTPPAETAVSRMARLIAQVQAHPFKARLTDTVVSMLTTVAKHKTGVQRLVMGHPRLFAPLILASLSKNRQTAAMQRTTLAFTMAQGGSAHNVLPESASCTVNVRLLQGDSVKDVLSYLTGFGIPFEVKAIQTSEATRASDPQSPGMRHLSRCIQAVFPDAVVTPYLMVGGTDCRHYQEVCDNAYRFLPARVSQEELALMHGRGEYLSVDNLQHMLDFYTLFLRELPQTNQ